MNGPPYLSPTYQLKNFCHIYTAADFLQALVLTEEICPAEESLVVPATDRPGWEVKRGEQVVFSHQFSISGNQVSHEMHYYGGYLVLIASFDCRHEDEDNNMLTIYRILQ